MRTLLTLIVVGFVVFCGWLVVESGFFECSAPNSGPCILLQSTTGEKNSSDANAPDEEPLQVRADDSVTFDAVGAPAKSVTLGSVDPNSSFTFQLELSSKGAAIRKATFRKFYDRDYKDPQPLVILSPVRQADGREILSMANREFVLVEHGWQFALDELSWKSFDVITAADGSQTARFEATIKVQDTNEPVLKLIKTYKIIPYSYLLECNIAVENLSGSEEKVHFNLAGPGGLGREGIRGDMRKVVGGFLTSEAEVVSSRQGVTDRTQPP